MVRTEMFSLSFLLLLLLGNENWMAGEQTHRRPQPQRFCGDAEMTARRARKMTAKKQDEKVKPCTGSMATVHVLQSRKEHATHKHFDQRTNRQSAHCSSHSSNQLWRLLLRSSHCPSIHRLPFSLCLLPPSPQSSSVNTNCAHNT